MVYDGSRNYIGDMHWREDQILQDGDEFELDRGVLIQVGEATGSMEQDLAGLFEKRKKAPEIAVDAEGSHHPVAVSMARPTAVQPSQLRPKTLNALLGTPKGRIGRAALPTKSPHELRMESENNSWDQDRLAKRQRIELQSGRTVEPNKMPPPRVPASFRVPDEGVKMTVFGAVIDKQSEEQRVPTAIQNLDLLPVGNLVSVSRSKSDKKGNASKRLVEQLPKGKYDGSGSSDDSTARQREKLDEDAQASPKAKSIAKRLDHEPKTGNARTSTIAKPVEVASDKNIASTNERPKQTLKLQMASRKPRKKLLYRDLLPQESTAIGRSSSDVSVLDRSSRDGNTSSRPDKRRKDPMAEFHQEEQERLKARLGKHRAKEMHWENEREELCGDAPEDLFLSQEDIDNVPAKNRRTGEKKPKEKAPNSCMTGSRHRHIESDSSSTRRPLSPESLPKVIPRPPSTVHSAARALAKTDEILFSRPQAGIIKPGEDNNVLPRVLPQELSSPSILRRPQDSITTPSPLQDRSHSSSSFQTEAHIPSSKQISRETVSTISRPDSDSLSVFANTVQPEVHRPKRRKSNTPPPSIPPLSANTVSAPSPPKYHPVSAPGLQTQPNVHPAKPATPEPPIADVIPPIPNAKLDTLLALSKIMVPKSTTVPEPVPRSKPSNQPAFTKVIPIPPIPKPPDETVEVLSSQPPSSPPPEAPTKAPRPPERKSDSLPAFTKVIPTKPRSPLKKSISDTSAMRPPAALPVSDGQGKEKALLDESGEKDEGVRLWSKEAWDLFGCDRDGVECTYEEFKRKEGLM